MFKCWGFSRDRTLQNNNNVMKREKSIIQCFNELLNWFKLFLISACHRGNRWHDISNGYFRLLKCQDIFRSWNKFHLRWQKKKLKEWKKKTPQTSVIIPLGTKLTTINVKKNTLNDHFLIFTLAHAFSCNNRKKIRKQNIPCFNFLRDRLLKHCGLCLHIRRMLSVQQLFLYVQALPLPASGFWLWRLFWSSFSVFWKENLKFKMGKRLISSSEAGRKLTALATKFTRKSSIKRWYKGVWMSVC